MASSQSAGASREIPVTAEIAKRAASLAWRDLPDDLVERTKQCLLDWFAVTIAGAQEELTDILVREKTNAKVGQTKSSLPLSQGISIFRGIQGS